MSGRTVGIAIGVVIVVALLGAIIFSPSGPAEFGSPEISGAVLPPLTDPATDPAIGSSAPIVEGTDFSDTPVAIDGSGPRALLFLAHWCPHCQNEVPQVQRWVDSGGAAGELIGIVTGTNSARDNYPPSKWLEREGWTSPVIVDDTDQSIAQAYGLTAYPYWVFIDGKGRIALRVTGGLEPADVEMVLSQLRAS